MIQSEGATVGFGYLEINRSEHRIRSSNSNTLKTKQKKKKNSLLSTWTSILNLLLVLKKQEKTIAEEGTEIIPSATECFYRT